MDCKYPTQCGLGFDCTECYADALTAAKARIAEQDKELAGLRFSERSYSKNLGEATGVIVEREARIAELEKALEPFAELGESYDESFADDHEATFADDDLTVGDLRRAAALLKEDNQ